MIIEPSGFLTTATPDLNGQARGKRYPAKALEKLKAGTAKMPLSVLSVDILGNDLENSPLVFESGDQDGFLRPTERGQMPMPWLTAPNQVLPMSLYGADGAPFAGDPRHALAAVLDRFAAKGLTPITATELEFFLIEDGSATPLAARLAAGGDILGLRTLEAHDRFLNDLYAGCHAMGISADTASSEAGSNQFEVTLTHGPTMKAADDTWLFKMLAKGIAHKHGYLASFAAKPDPNDAGTGMHMHFSVLDRDGRNVFDDGTKLGADLLRQAIAGCLVTMTDATLIFAPNLNSYERLVPGAHAPTNICWGYENRTVALRVPDSPPVARRIEHRVAGGDINPYLLLAAILGGALIGIEDGLEPPAPVTGNAYAQALPKLAPSWEAAATVFEESTWMPRIFPSLLIDLFVRSKRQDMAIADRLGPHAFRAHCLDRV